jgi:alginate O-acetyltransferase complex protein AlgI
MPYLSQNITEFWRRWHISLSTWLRDYLYISLGGNRKGWVRTYINLMITMILGGLWHGASWNFVIWGTLHGFALAFHKLWSARFKQGGYVLQIISGIVTFLFVMLAWVLFRAHDTRTMLAVYDKLFFIEPFGASWYYRATFMAFALALLGHLVGIWRTSPELVFFETPYSYRVAFAVTSVLLIIYVFAPTNVSPFIYFQF